MLSKAIITIDGYVQGVGYRYKVAYIARRYKLKGYVKNLEDGRVEVCVEGNREDIKRFIDDININDPPIHVQEVDVDYQDYKGEYNVFRIETGTLEEEMVEGFSTGALYLDNLKYEIRDFREEFRDYRKEFRDFAKRTDDNFKKVIDTQDKILGEIREIKDTQEKTLNEIRGLRQELLAILDERLKKIEEDIARIKAKINLD